MKIIKKILPAVLVAVCTFFATMYIPLDAQDNYITDKLYSRLRPISRDIMILSVDSKTLDEYGNFTTWSREKTAEALEKLYEDPENSPAVVGIDITFQGEGDPDTDKRLGDAISKGNVVLSSTIFYKGRTETDENGKLFYNSDAINLIEKPTAVIAKDAKLGFTNSLISNDGVVRTNKLKITHEGEELYSFAYVIANEYSEQKGKSIVIPKVNKQGIYRFFYAGKSGEVQHISLCRYLNGEIPQSEFKDKIVLIGAYASGMQDSYIPTADAGVEMYGVEIHANVIQSLFDGSSALIFNRYIYAIILSVLTTIVFWIVSNKKLIFGIMVPAVCIAANIFAGIILAKNGLLISQIFAIIIFVLMIAYSIIRRYLVEAKKRRHITKVFGKYMEPKIVAAMAKGDTNALKLGGDRREVAVMFVDVRGFTKMSETLEPEDIVGILNEYLGLVTDCIFKHGGMLDKYVGDCAMAVFNAPIDQEDYLYEAVATAWDIAQGYEKLAGSLMERFGRSVSYGIGVNCGPAVVGNIGCDFRMDYTAIGDTVNTAARLEANAATGEILISEELKNRLEGRILTESNGMMQFKGKAEPMSVYKVTGLIK